MAKLTAADIRRMMQPMAAFMPALNSALEIIDAAEEAEKRHASLIADIGKLEEIIKGLGKQQAEATTKMQAAKVEANKAVAEAEDRKEAGRAELEPLKKEAAAWQDKIAVLITQHGDTKVELEKEIEDIRRRRAGMEKELMQWAASHGMRA